MSIKIDFFKKREMELIPPTIPLRPLSWNEINRIYPFEYQLSSEEDTEHTYVYKSGDYAVKVFQNTDPLIDKELRVGSKLNHMVGTTEIFVRTYGYLLSTEHPPMGTIKPYKDANDVVIPHTHYIYVFLSSVESPLDNVDDDQVENMYFQFLIGLYHARRKLKFCHHDVHKGNLMFDPINKTSFVYQISPGFTVMLTNVEIQAKLIDYGKSVADERYTDDQWQIPKYRPFWNKSDIYDLSVTFLHEFEDVITPRFEQFLRHTMNRFRASHRLISTDKIQNDSSANYQNIETLLREYFPPVTALRCDICGAVNAEFTDVNGGLYCGLTCQIKHY